MKHLTLLFLITCLFSCGQKAPISSSGILIKNVTILQVEEEKTTSVEQDVLIENTKIAKIGKDLNIQAAQIIDGTGKYLMPGLTEMHAHIPTPKDEDDSYVKETLFLYLSQGITTIRGMLGDPYHLTLRKDIADGKILGPRIYTSSPSCNGNSIPDKATAIEKVTAYKNDGYDFLKIHPGIKLDVWQQLESTAKEVGIRFAGHVPVDVGINRAIEAGYGTIDHLDGYLEGLVPSSANVAPDQNGFFGYNFTHLADLKNIKDLVSKTKEANVSVVLTQTLFTRWFSPTDPARDLLASEMKYMPSKTRFAWRQNKEQLINNEDYSAEQWSSYNSIRTQLLSALYKRGVTILLGSDAPQVMNVPGFSLHHEMKEMANAGMSNYDILKSGTSGPADFFSASGQFGTIQEKASADFILLNKHPLEDISNAQDIAGVMVRGYWLSRDMIDEGLKKIELKHAN